MNFQEIFHVENIKCGGCMNTIIKGIHQINAGYQININAQEGCVVIDSNEPIPRNEVLSALDRMGYPLSENNSLVKKAQSYVSCAIGRITSSSSQ